MGWPDDVPSGGYPSHMQPLAYPAGTMQAALDKVNEVAGVLSGDLWARPDLVTVARDGWEGVFRDDFDSEWGAQETALGDLKTALQTLAGQIGDAMDRAEDINTARAAQREEHDAAHPSDDGYGFSHGPEH